MTKEHFEKFSFLISGLYKDIQKTKARYSDSLNLKSVHIFWLYLLKENKDGLSASEIAKKSKSTRALVSREIAELLHRSLIETKEKSTNRRYNQKFTLTQDGKEAAEKIGEIAYYIQNRISKNISEEDLVKFYETLEILLDNFDKLTKEDLVEEK